MQNNPYEFRVWAELRPNLDDPKLPEWLRAWIGYEGWFRRVEFNYQVWFQPIADGWQKQHFVPLRLLWCAAGRDYGRGVLAESRPACYEDPSLEMLKGAQPTKNHVRKTNAVGQSRMRNGGRQGRPRRQDGQHSEYKECG